MINSLTVVSLIINHSHYAPLQSPHPVVSLQFSGNNQFILTSISNNNYQELILWDLSNFRYMKKSKIPQDIEWFNATCSASENVRAIWDNDNLNQLADNNQNQIATRQTANKQQQQQQPAPTVVNMSCHVSNSNKLVVASDGNGHLRLFKYPCREPTMGFYQRRYSSMPAVVVRFLSDDQHFVSSGSDGSVSLWGLQSTTNTTNTTTTTT